MLKAVMLVFVATSAFAQFKENAIGVAYLNAETKVSYSLTIAFPAKMLSENLDGKTTFTSRETLTLFDSKGEMCFIKGPFNFKVDAWCENDGGIQSRATLKITIGRNKFQRTPFAINSIQNIACFVVVNKSSITSESNLTKSAKDVVLTGDFNNDGKTDCFISTYYDDAENCDGVPVNHLGINLHAGNLVYALRCCGP